MVNEPEKAAHKLMSEEDRITHSIMERKNLPNLQASLRREKGEEKVHISYEKDGVKYSKLTLPKEELGDYIAMLKHFQERIEKYEEADMNGVYKKPCWEIINPSDKGFIYGEFKTVAVATMLFGGPMYGLEEHHEEEKDRAMPITFDKWREWFQDQFDQNIVECWRDVGTEALTNSLRSVHLNRKRTSLNNFVASAHKKADQLERMENDANVEEFLQDIQSEEEEGDQ